MSYVDAIDISQWQGSINWGAVPQKIAIIKMSGGDNGLYFDSRANANYTQAKAAGKAVGLYHFAGGKDPIAEADFFVRACSPLEENDVLILDWEVSNPDPVAWCSKFVNHVHEKTGVWPLIYMNLATLNTHYWDSILKNCGLWVAAWNNNPNGDLATPHTYVMHQYTSDGAVAGIAGRVDKDAWYGTVDQFKKYGYHAPAAPVPVPAPQPPSSNGGSPAPDNTPGTGTVTSGTGTTYTYTVTDRATDVETNKIVKENNSLLKQILALLQGLVTKFTNIFRS